MKLRVSGFAEAEERLRGMSARLRDLTPVLEVAAADTVALIDDSFAGQHAPDGGTWADHSETTLRMRARRAAGPTVVASRYADTIGPLREGQSRTRRRAWTRARSAKVADAVFNAKLLLDTARLRQSITYSVGKTGFRFGTNVIYAATQQFGRADNKIFGKHLAPIPARPFLPVTSTGRGQFALMTGGAAGAHWQRVKEMIRRYIATGEIT